MSKRILIAMAWLHIIGGIGLPFACAFVAPVSDVIQRTLQGTPAQQGATFWVGVFGPTVASWGVLFLGQLRMYFAAPTSGGWRVLMASVLMWVVLDTAYCLYMDVPQALLSNVPAALLLLLPLWCERVTVDRISTQ